MLLWLCACLTEIPAENLTSSEASPENPAAAPGPPILEITGRATPEGLDVPPLPEAAGLVADRCAGLRRGWWPQRQGKQGAAASAEICSVERLADPARPEAPAVYALRLGGAMVLTAGLEPSIPARPARARWEAIDAILAICLGDPLDLPPARDPLGHRSMEGDVWALSFSGRGPCRLDGRLLLGVRADRADAARLTAGGLRWSAGGRERVRGWMKERLQRDAGDPASALSGALTEAQREQIRDLP